MTSISLPVTLVVDVSVSQKSAGTWKSPIKMPESALVSTRVNPVEPRPGSKTGAHSPASGAMSLSPSGSFVHLRSSNVTSNNLPNGSPAVFCPKPAAPTWSNASSPTNETTVKIPIVSTSTFRSWSSRVIVAVSATL